jgi:hypothetical protein
MLENLLKYYRKSDGATKKKILGCIFAEKLVKWQRAQSQSTVLRAKNKCEFESEF